MENFVSIIIPCKNEGVSLVKTIDSIKLHGDFSIIVSDCSTDNTLELLKSFHPEVKIIKGGLPSIARNNGVKLSKMIIFF